MKKKTKKAKFKYYGLIGVSDNFLYGAFEASDLGLKKAKEHLLKIDSDNKYYKIKKF